MARKKSTKLRTKTVLIKLEHGRDVFSTIWPFRSSGDTPELSGVQDLRHLLSNEKARILFTIRAKEPGSIYELAKILGRDFKSVRKDVKLLQKFGLISLKSEGKTRKKLKPSIALDELHLTFRL
jgi:predicted transcriptional regulator